MKKTITTSLFLFILMFSTSVFAQTDDNEKMPAAERAKYLTEWMKTNLNLTPEQEQQVAPINLDCATKIDSVRNLKLSKMDKLKEARKIQ
jgi:Spy/CpxP family protein refolding chaperone